MLAPPRVVELGVETFRTVRTLRDLLADGAHITDGAFQTAQHTYYRGVRLQRPPCMKNSASPSFRSSPSAARPRKTAWSAALRGRYVGRHDQLSKGACRVGAHQPCGATFRSVS
ncbi:hypothetical protein GCM10009574_005220 [Streptomyces asiaticus]|uniref:Uncharacterized protein n=2 Tax=Streptomyces rhizosphaericus TaxID=114699 RepID=A0ABN1PMU0_9ACTN